MEPDTRKTVYWIVKPTFNIAREMIAIFPVNVVSSRNVSSGMKFNVSQRYPKYSFEKLKNAVEKKIRGAL
jgi:hypothetical protein